jgi:hypothetical protein
MKVQIFGVKSNFDYLTEDDMSRGNPNSTWNDLWTNLDLYNQEVEKNNNGWSIQGIVHFEDIIGVLELPSPIVTFGWFDLLKKTDFPTSNLSWTIVSKKFLEVISSFNIYPKIYPIRVLNRAKFDNIYSENIRKYENIEYSEVLEFGDDLFYGISLPNFPVLTDESDITASPKSINWLEITETPEFFVDPKSSELLVNYQGRDALEKAGLNGIRFTEPFQPF